MKKNLERQEAELERLKEIIARSAGLVKLVCGVCNGAAHALALEARDQPLVLILREVLGGVCANVPGYGQIVNFNLWRHEGRESDD